LQLWAAGILGSARFPDARLTRRAVSFLAQKAGAPEDGILRAAKDPAAAKACYRFLENERVTAETIWESMHEGGAKSLADRDLVLIVQDTTTFMFPHLKATTGLGTVNNLREEALLLHSALAVSPGGVTLGLLYNHVWARPPKEFGKNARRKRRPIEEKESFEWILGIRQAMMLRDRFARRTQLLHVFDRAGDVHEVLSEIISGGQGCIVRCARNRRVEGEYGYIRQTVAAARVRKRYKIDVPRKPGKPKRRATVELRSAGITLRPPSNYPGRRPLTLNVVWVHEPNAPDGAEPLDWLLLTTLPIETVKQCLRIVKFYKLRWRIEELHLTIKSGCKIEKTQLKTAARIEILLSFCCAIAMRIVQMTYLARTDPDAPCTDVLGEDEWRVLWAFVHKQHVPQANSPPPTMYEAVRMIARLGGHLGRKSDGMPGVRVMWRGWRDMQLLVEGYRVNR